MCCVCGISELTLLLARAVEYKGEDKVFKAEEISSMVLVSKKNDFLSVLNPALKANCHFLSQPCQVSLS